MSEDRVAPEGDLPAKGDVRTFAVTSETPSPEGHLNTDKQPGTLPSSEPRSTVENSSVAPKVTKRTPSDRRKTTVVTGFGSSDANDGREKYDWETRYPDTALKAIRKERRILFFLLYAIPVLMVLIWSKWIWGELGLGQARYSILARFSYAWLGGMLGGTLFDLKWLYHSVAKGLWHQDRALWRFFTPHISGALAFSFVLLISSNLLRIFDQTTFTSSMSVAAVSFLVGYFSDSAIAKLAEIAETLFGTTRKAKERVSEEGKVEQPSSPQAPKPQAGSPKPRAGKS
jgi:hypothetical protein